MTFKKVLIKIKEYFLVAVAGALNGISVHTFVHPNFLVPGGFTGLASLISYFTGWDISLLYIVLNIPLLVLAVIIIKGDFAVKTIVATVSCSLLLKVLPADLIFTESVLIAVIFGGIMVGTSMFVATINNGSNGGTEVIGKIVEKKRPEVDLSQIITIANLSVLVLGSFLLIFFQDGSLWIPFYSLIYVIVGGRVLGMLSLGIDRPKRFMIITKKHEEIAEEVSLKFKRGVSIADTYDFEGNSKEYKAVIIVCQHRQSGRLKKLIKKIDGEAFTIVKRTESIILRPTFNRSYKYDKDTKN